MSRYDIEVKEESIMLEKIKTEIEEKAEYARRMQEAEMQIKLIQQRIIANALSCAGGLPYVLNEKYTQGGKTGTYKVDTWKMCDSKVAKWKKEHGGRLDDSEKQALEQTILRLFASPDKKESKEWAKPFDQSKPWNQIAKYLGEERALNLYKELVK